MSDSTQGYVDLAELEALLAKALVEAGCWDALDEAHQAREKLTDTLPAWLPNLIATIRAQAAELAKVGETLEVATVGQNEAWCAYVTANVARLSAERDRDAAVRLLHSVPLDCFPTEEARTFLATLTKGAAHVG